MLDLDSLMNLVYEELRDLARRWFTHEEPQTIQPTVLVHEAFLRLVDQDCTSYESQRHFFAVAAIMMRRVLVDHARSRRRLKRGGGRKLTGSITLIQSVGDTEAEGLDLLALNDALTALGELDERKLRIVEYRFFAGLSIADVAAQLGISEKTVKRDWQIAKGWLYSRLGGS